MVRLVTVIGHGTNLLEHFINHYNNFVDEINIVVYNSDKYPNIDKEVEEIIKSFNKVRIDDVVYEKAFDWGMVTNLYNKTKNKYPNDWWVVADIDEFHLYPNNDIRSLILECDRNGWKLVRGGFIDRIGEDGEFVDLEPMSDKSIWEQLPRAGFFRYPMSKACPNKICIMKGDIELTDGQHYAKINDITTWRHQGWSHPLIAPYDVYSVQVHHFKWDRTSIDRIRAIANVGAEYSYSEEYRIMYRQLAKTRFKLDIMDPEFMFETRKINEPDYNQYKQWNKLIKQIVSI